MKRIFITYGTKGFEKTLKRIKREAKALKLFDKVILYTPNDLPAKIKSSPLMQSKHGAGCWLWKPYVICETMERYPDAIIVYADAGCTLNKNYDEWNQWFRIMETTDTILTCYRPDVDYGWVAHYGTSSVKISTWTKRLTIDYFDKRFASKDWHDENKIWAGFIVAKNNSLLIRDVLKTMLNHPEIVSTPKEEELKNQYNGFCEHRYDQSIITPLAYWYTQNHPNIVKILPETAESISSSAVAAKRIKDKDVPSLISKIVMKVKSLLGETWYNRLHFWNN